MQFAYQYDLPRRVLDALDAGVLVVSPDLEHVLFQNASAQRLIGDKVPSPVLDAAETFLCARRDLGRMPPSMRIEINERGFYVYVVASPGDPPAEIIFLREEVLRDSDLFRLLNARFKVSRREYQVITGLRLGKTNRQIGHDLGINAGTVARHIHHLLGRFSVPNRTRLVKVVDDLVARRE